MLLAAAAGHAAALTHHLDGAHGGVAASATFLGVACAQAYLAARLATRPTTGVERTVAAFSLGLIVTWVVSRTSGLPFGPHSGDPEPVGPLDAAVAAAQIGVLVLLVRARWLVVALAIVVAAGVTASTISSPVDATPTVHDSGAHHHP